MMEYREPTQQEIDDARVYIRERIDAQHECESQLQDLFDEAAQRIAVIIAKHKRRQLISHSSLRFSAGSSLYREVSAILDWLQSEIDRWVLYYAIPDEAEEDETSQGLIYDAIHEEDHGHTYDEREDLYKRIFLASLASFDEWGVLDDEDELIEAIEESTAPARNRWQLLAANSIAIGFSALALSNAVSRNAIGFINYPGSSFPCPMCVERFNKFFPITDTGNHPPLHPHCCCVPVYIYL